MLEIKNLLNGIDQTFVSLLEHHSLKGKIDLEARPLEKKKGSVSNFGVDNEYFYCKNILNTNKIELVLNPERQLHPNLKYEIRFRIESDKVNIWKILDSEQLLDTRSIGSFDKSILHAKGKKKANFKYSAEIFVYKETFYNEICEEIAKIPQKSFGKKYPLK